MNASGRVAAVSALAGLLAAFLPALVSGDEEMVVVTRPGTVFHRAGSTDLRGHGYEKPLAQALASGYLPCQSCFAKISSGSLRSGAALGAASAASFGEHVVVPPGLRAGSTVSQPFGVQIGRLHSGGQEREGVRDPYEQLETIIKPGKEQGAFETDATKGR